MKNSAFLCRLEEGENRDLSERGTGVGIRIDDQPKGDPRAVRWGRRIGREQCLNKKKRCGTLSPHLPNTMLLRGRMASHLLLGWPSSLRERFRQITTRERSQNTKQTGHYLYASATTDGGGSKFFWGNPG